MEEDTEEGVREEEEGREFAMMPQVRVSDSMEFNKYLVDPLCISDSPYHSFVTKDLAVSKLSREDVELINWDFRLIDLFIFLGVPEMARVYHAEMLARINALRSIDGFERIQQSTVTQILRKHVEEERRKGLLGGK